ncbi:MAG: L-rhamnose mutarotase [Pseudomonadota bacterium]
MKRYGWVIALKAEKRATYEQLHRDVWDDVLSKISDCSIRNYTIFLREPENLLFGYFEYVGNDFDADMAKMANDSRTQEWWELTDPCQTPLETAAAGETWSPLREVFHVD